MRDDVLYGQVAPPCKVAYEIQPSEPETEAREIMQTKIMLKSLFHMEWWMPVTIGGDPAYIARSKRILRAFGICMFLETW
jgi:hypothetical protein